MTYEEKLNGNYKYRFLEEDENASREYSIERIERQRNKIHGWNEKLMRNGRKWINAITPALQGSREEEEEDGEEL